MDNPNSNKGLDNPPIPLAALKASASSLVPAKESLRKAALAGPAGPKQIGVNFSVGAVCQALRRRWILAFFLALLLMAGGATGAWFALQPVSTARATLRVAAAPRILFTTADNTSGIRDDSVNYQRTQAIHIKNRLVLNAALKIKDVKDLSIVRDKFDILDWLDRQLQVDTTNGTEIIRVSLSGDEPQELVVLLNAIVDAYLTDITNEERGKRLKRYQQLDKYNTKYQTTLTAKRQKLREMEGDGSGFNDKTLTATHEFNLEMLGNAKKELLLCNTEIVRMNAGLSSQLASDRSNGLAFPLLTADAILANDPEAARLRHDLEQKKDKLEKTKLVSVRGAEYPKVKSLENEIETTRKALDARNKGVDALVAEMNKARRDVYKKEGAETRKQQLAALEAWRDSLKKQVESLTNNMQHVARSSDILALHQEIAEVESVAKTVAHEFETLSVELEAPSRVTLEEAAIIGTNAEKKRFMGMGGAALFGLAFALCGVAWLDLRTCRLSSPDDLHGLGIRLVGSIPNQLKRGKDGVSSRKGSDDENLAQQVFTSSIDATRTMLLHAAQAQSLQVVMITSALSGEGKTSLACHLAASLAYTGRRVLLLDCDMRKPMVHKIFKLNPAPGFGSLLVGESMVEDVVQATSLEGLSVIVAGTHDDNTVRALARDRVKAVLSQLREQYDFIIVDSCPVLPVADSLLIAPHVDAVLFSLLNDVSRMPAVGAAWKRLETLGTPMLGAVVNGVQEAHYGYLYGAR